MWVDPWVGKSPWRKAWRPTPVFCLGNPMDRGAWRTPVPGSQSAMTEATEPSTHTHTHTSGACSQMISPVDCHGTLRALCCVLVL